MEKEPVCICLHEAAKHTEKGCEEIKREYGLKSNIPKDVKCRCMKYMPLTIWSER